MAVITRYFKDSAQGKQDKTISKKPINAGYKGNQQEYAVRNQESFVKVVVDTSQLDALLILQFWEKELAVPENTLVEITEVEFTTATGL
jgi:hypothetical protein